MNAHNTIRDWSELFDAVAGGDNDDADSNPLRRIKVLVEEFKRKAEVTTRGSNLKYPSKPQEFEKGKNTIFVPALPKVRTYQILHQIWGSKYATDCKILASQSR